MEQLKFEYPSAKRHVTKRAHVGVVGSGDMEVLMEPSRDRQCAMFRCKPASNGFSKQLEVR